MKNRVLLLSSILLLGATVAMSSEGLTAKKADNYHNSLAALPFQNDYPTTETAGTLQKELAFQRATQVYLWSLPAVNMLLLN